MTPEEIETLRTVIREEIRHLPTREEFDARLRVLPTREELDARLGGLPTREEFDARLGGLPTREEFDARLRNLPTRTDLGALADELRGGMRLLAEGHAALDEKLSTLEHGIVRLEKRTESIDLNVTWLRTRLTAMEASRRRSRRRRSR